jgi:hypothetical protein
MTTVELQNVLLDLTGLSEESVVSLSIETEVRGIVKWKVTRFARDEDGELMHENGELKMEVIEGVAP